MPSTTAGALLELVRAGRAATRTDLGELTGLSRTAVSSRVGALLSAGLLSEAGELASRGGRPPGALTLRADAAHVVGIAVGRSRSQLGLFDLEGAALASESSDHEVGSAPADVMAPLADRLAALLREHPGPVLGLGLSLPGSVDPRRLVSVDSPVMRGWAGVPLAPYLAGVTGVTGAPVYLTNDTVALTRSELLGHSPAVDALVVKASTGLGVGQVADGRLVGADRGVTGELGHTRVAEAGDRLCRCGATGCLETLAGGWALTRAMQEAGLSVRHVRDVVGVARQGHPVARNALRESGRLVGQVLAVAVTLLNPDSIVVGGDMAGAFDLWSAGARESVYSLSTAGATRDLDFRPAAHGEQAALVGCAATVLDAELAAAVVDRRLRQV